MNTLIKTKSPKAAAKLAVESLEDRIALDASALQMDTSSMDYAEVRALVEGMMVKYTSDGANAIGGKTYFNGDDRTGADDLKNPGPDEPDYPAPRIWLSEGILRVQGSQDGDNIEISYADGGATVVVELNGMTAEFDTDDVSGLIVYGLAGDDTIDNSTDIADTIWGGLGDDNIYGGSGVSYLFGQDGSDIIDGGDGNDFLYGGDETDYLFGGNGSDYVSGQGGADFVSGGYLGGTANDNGADLLVGGSGGDCFYLPDNPASPVDAIVDMTFAEGDGICF